MNKSKNILISIFNSDDKEVDNDIYLSKMELDCDMNQLTTHGSRDILEEIGSISKEEYDYYEKL